ncbi:MAG TPA: MBL fold metallo-hydrolase [Gaiellaceae bacterium]|nr:MBL fold metallo-hydrolase [Gaiellaceae bacterium]
MQPVEVEVVGDGVHRVTHPLPYALDHVHTYALEGDDGWAIVDTGHVWKAEERWRQALARLGRPRVTRIVVTHFHPDHLLGSGALQSLTGADVVQGRLDREVSSRVYGDGRFEGVVPPEPTLLLDEDDVLEAGSRRLRVFHMPGHADGHITLYDEQRGELFGGDVILERITPNVSWWPGMELDPLARYQRTLERLQELAPALVYPGHHGLIRNTSERAAEIREHHRLRLDETERHLREGARTAAEVLVRIWGRDLTPHEQRFAYGEAISHLQRLQRLGRAAELAPDHWQATAA